jgi:hypothetical protein
MAAPGEFQAELQPCNDEYAFMVTSVNQDDPYNNFNNVTYPAWALGAPDGLPCSIGSGGFIVLDMGTGHEIIDGPGNDFTVTEVIHPRDPDPESYEVYAGNAYEQNRFIGTATGTASFDLSTAGVPSTQYLKIVDVSGSSPGIALAGMDLDGITILNSRSTEITGTLSESLGHNPDGIEIKAYPNPFNPSTVIRYKLQVGGLVTLRIYNVSGRKIAELVNDWQDAGQHEATFDGSGLTSGIYLCKLKINEYEALDKMLLVK